jgi:hypothetical protein
LIQDKLGYRGAAGTARNALPFFTRCPSLSEHAAEMTAQRATEAGMPCVIDIEASGFGRHSYPIEVGYALPDGRSRCTLICPATHWTHWDPAAEQVHGITRPTLFSHGRPAAEVAGMLNADLAGRTVYCDGWAHDYAWLAAIFEEAGLRPSFRLESVNALLDDAAMARLEPLQARARQDLGLLRHRASNDARALQQALLQLGRVG